MCRLVTALDGMRIVKVAAGGWHSAAISDTHDLYMFGWNESGQLAQPTNLARPAEVSNEIVKLILLLTISIFSVFLRRGEASDGLLHGRHGRGRRAAQGGHRGHGGELYPYKEIMTI